MDYFNIAFSSPCPFLPFVSKGLMDSEGCCPMDCFNTVFSHVCPSFFFVPKWLMDSKGCQMDSF